MPSKSRPSPSFRPSQLGLVHEEIQPAHSADMAQYASMTSRVWPSDYRTSCVTVAGARMCASPSALQIDGTVQDLSAGHASAVYERKVDCSAECAVQWPEKEMKSACSHGNDNRKSKRYNEAVPCGYYWSGKRFVKLGDRKAEACAVDVRYG